jgi:hypothetical protein
VILLSPFGMALPYEWLPGGGLKEGVVGGIYVERNAEGLGRMEHARYFEKERR